MHKLKVQCKRGLIIGAKRVKLKPITDIQLSEFSVCEICFLKPEMVTYL